MLFPISKAVTKLEGGDYPTLNHILECLFLMLGIWKKKNLPNLEYNLLLLFNRYFGIEHTEGEEEQLEWYTSDIWDDIILATILDPSKKSFHFAPEPAASIFQKERTYFKM